LPLVSSVGEAISAWWNLDKEVTDSLQTHSISTAATTKSALQEAPNSSSTLGTHKMIEVLGYNSNIARIREVVDQICPQFIHTQQISWGEYHLIEFCPILSKVNILDKLQLCSIST
jgi:hypothetical protein